MLFQKVSASLLAHTSSYIHIYERYCSRERRTRHRSPLWNQIIAKTTVIKVEGPLHIQKYVQQPFLHKGLKTWHRNNKKSCYYKKGEKGITFYAHREIPMRWPRRCVIYIYTYARYIILHHHLPTWRRSRCHAPTEQKGKKKIKRAIKDLFFVFFFFMACLDEVHCVTTSALRNYKTAKVETGKKKRRKTAYCTAVQSYFYLFVNNKKKKRQNERVFLKHPNLCEHL